MLRSFKSVYPWLRFPLEFQRVDRPRLADRKRSLARWELNRQSGVGTAGNAKNRKWGATEVDYSLSIQPGISPATRHQLEDQLDIFLDSFGGCTTGGGTMLDGSGSDLDFECEEAGFEEPLKSFLQEKANINATMTLQNLEDMSKIFTIQCVAKKPWWRFW